MNPIDLDLPKSTRKSDRKLDFSPRKSGFLTSRSRRKDVNSIDTVSLVNTTTYFAFKVQQAELLRVKLKAKYKIQVSTLPKISKIFHIELHSSDYIVFHAPLSEMFNLYRQIKSLDPSLVEIKNQLKFVNNLTEQELIIITLEYMED